MCLKKSDLKASDFQLLTSLLVTCCLQSQVFSPSLVSVNLRLTQSAFVFSLTFPGLSAAGGKQTEDSSHLTLCPTFSQTTGFTLVPPETKKDSTQITGGERLHFHPNTLTSTFPTKTVALVIGTSFL